MKLFDLTSKKKKAGPPPVKVADLDALISRTMTFTLHGQDHTLRVPTVEDWLVTVAAQSKLSALREKEVITPAELIEAYWEFISKMAPSITKEDISKSSQVQVAALWQIALDVMNGYSEKKNLLNLMLLGMTDQEMERLSAILIRLKSTPPELLTNSSASTGI
jgi:hypothetical protein